MSEVHHQNDSAAISLRSAYIGVGLIVIAFFLCLLPYASHFITFLPDEDSYVQGALIMIDSGDYLTPKTGTYDLRLLKPPLAYWLSIAGMKVFGISVLGLRIFWLIMAAGILGLTARLTKQLTRDANATLLAVAVLAPNILFIRLSLVAIPDAPLIFFMLVAMSGFVGLLTAPDFHRQDAWMAYGGTALAVLTKGLLPVVMLVYFVGAGMIIPEARTKCKRLLAPLPIVVSLPVAASWFVYQIIRYPEIFYQQFVGDQVTRKVALSVWSVFESLVMSSASLVLPMIAWLLILLTASVAADKRPSLRSLGVGAPLLAGWILVNILVFIPAARIYVRYVLPALPALAILVAVALASLDPDVVRRHLQKLLVLAIILAVPVVAGFLAISAPLMNWFVVFALFASLAVATIAFWLASRSRFLVVPVVALALLPVGALLLISPSISAFAMPDIANVISRELETRDLSDARIVFVDAERTATKAQLYEARTAPFEQSDGDKDAVAALASDEADRPDVVVTPRRDVADQLSTFGYEIHELRGGWRDVDWDDIVDAIRQLTIPETRQKSADRIYVAVNAV